MVNMLPIVTRLGDKSGSLGAVIAAMGCSFCFPAIASLGATPIFNHHPGHRRDHSG